MIKLKVIKSNMENYNNIIIKKQATTQLKHKNTRSNVSHETFYIANIIKQII